MKSVTFWDVATYSQAVVPTSYFLGLLLYPEDRSSTFLRNFVELPDYMVAYPRR
jgi:hypothetical protein